MAMLVITRGYIQILLPCRPVRCEHFKTLESHNNLFGNFIAKCAALNRSPFLVLKLKVPKHPQTVIPRIDSRSGGFPLEKSPISLKPTIYEGC
jgi:hypothetical protein